VKVKIQKLFWTSYWGIYQALNKAHPYQESVRRGSELLKVQPQGRYLDLGCGPGTSTQALAGKVIGLDYSLSALEIARCQCSQAAFVCGDFNYQIPFLDEKFDGVFAHNVLYLARDPLQTLAEIHRVLKPGGILVMSNPLPKANPFAILKSHLFMEYRLLPSKLKIIPAALYTFGMFLAFLPFQIALRLKFGGASHFWSQQQWEQVLDDLKKRGYSYSIMAVETSYAGQNITFALKKE